MTDLTLSKLEARAVPDPFDRTRVLIMRHAQSTFNVQQRYQGRSDEPELTDIGAAAAEQTGRHLVTERIDVLISSPLRRAVQTAEIIKAVLYKGGQGRPPLNVSDALMEVDLPQWEGLALEAVRRQLPDSHRIWSEQPNEFQMSANGLSTFFPVRELFKQANRFWRDFLQHYAGKTALLVTHGGTAKALISTAVGVKPERFHSLQQSNCGISILEFTPGSGTAQVAILNLTDHLGERMPKLKLGRRGARIVMVAGDNPWQHPSDVSQLLEAVRVDFVLSADDPQSQRMARALIAAHPHARLSIFPGDVLFHSRHPETMPLPDPTASFRRSLSTSVFVGRSSELDATLSAVLGLDSRSSPWKHVANAVLHYPATNTTPVIQAFNMKVQKKVVEPVATEVLS